MKHEEKDKNIKNKRISLLAVIICFSASTYALYDFFVAVAPGVMAHQLMVSFDMTSTELGWIGASFFYAYALMQIPSGWMLDRFGARRMLIVYTLVTGLGLVLFSLTHHFVVAMGARFLTGTGVCIGFLASYNLASRWLHHRYFSTVAASLHLLGVLGAILAQEPLAMMVNHFGWRQSLQLLSGVTLVLAFLYAFTIRDGYRSTSMDTIKFSAAVRYWFLNPQLKWIAFIGFLSWLPVSTIGALWGVPYLMKVFNCDNVTASKYCSFFWIGSGVGGYLLCGVSEWKGQRKMPLQSGFVLALISSLIIVILPSFSITLMILALFSLGISVTVQTMTFSLIKENVPIEYFSAASGLNNAFSMMSSALGQALVGMLLDWHRITQQAADYSVLDYQYALLVLPMASFMGWFVVTFKIKETHCQSLENFDGQLTQPKY